jgi:hypothetical protein
VESKIEDEGRNTEHCFACAGAFEEAKNTFG